MQGKLGVAPGVNTSHLLKTILLPVIITLATLLAMLWSILQISLLTYTPYSSDLNPIENVNPAACKISRHRAITDGHRELMGPGR